MNNLPEEKPSLLEKIALGLFSVWRCYDRIMYERRKRVSLKKYQEVMDWVKKQNLPLDTARELKLPFYLAGITSRSTVYALHTDDERHCILMKTWISFGRENFYGTFYCDEPLAVGNEVISIRGKYICRDRNGEEDYGPNFQALYITKRHNDQLFEVDYTLN